MIIITGTQRSGTSLIASLFKEEGYDLGTSFWDNRVDGGLENPDSCNFFRELIGNDFPFTKYWSMIERDQFYPLRNLHNYFKVIKFSYLLMDPIFLDYWYQIRGTNDVFIICWRSADKVARSKQEREHIFKKEDWPGLPTDAREINRVRWHCLQRMEMKYKMRTSIIQFPPPANPILRINKTLKNEDIRLNPETWEKVYDPTKVHHG